MCPGKENDGFWMLSSWKFHSWTRRSWGMKSHAHVHARSDAVDEPSPALASHCPSPREKHRALTHDLWAESFLRGAQWTVQANGLSWTHCLEYGKPDAKTLSTNFCFSVTLDVSLAVAWGPNQVMLFAKGGDGGRIKTRSPVSDRLQLT